MEIKEYVAQEKLALKHAIEGLEIKPRLVIVQMNDDPASNAYVKGKLKDCDEVGIISELIKLPLDASEEELFNLLDELNNRDDVSGYIVQMPLPRHIDEEKVKLYVNPSKDVDGFHPCSSFVACTPKGVIDYLKAEGISFSGKNAVVIGRSNIVGRPLAKLLIDLSTNCTVLHSRTKEEDKIRYLENADLIFTAVGRKWLLDETISYKSDAVIVDIGIVRDEGKLYGDCKPGLKVKLQTPVPGGVGLLTRLSLLKNVWEAYKNGI